jgi:hypothetical membrane protein
MNERRVSPISLRGLFWAVIAGVVLYVVLDAIAQSLPPHYSPIQDAESDLAVGPYGYIMTVNFLNRGLLSLVFVYALSRTFRLTGAIPTAPSSGRNPYSRGLSLLGVWGVGAIILAIFPTDVPATPLSWHGTIHLLVALVAFLAGAFGTLSLSRQFRASQALRGAAGYSMAIAALSVVFCFVTLGLGFVDPHLAARVGGLDERIFLGLVLVWMVAVSLHMLRHQSTMTKDASATTG